MSKPVLEARSSRECRPDPITQERSRFAKNTPAIVPDKLPHRGCGAILPPAAITTDSVGAIALLPMSRLQWPVDHRSFSPDRRTGGYGKAEEASAKSSKEEEFGRF